MQNELSNIPYQGKFIEQVEAAILGNISNEQFGVSELADLMNMSRSSLLRKIKKQTRLSASQFIRQVRLKKGMELLEETELTVSEISYQVGFGNNSYFIKCFREYYGHSPGEVRKNGFEEAVISERNEVESKVDAQKSFLKQYRLHLLVTIFVVLGIAAFLIFQNSTPNSEITNSHITKSLAVLPFKNMSSDSTNLYFVNGLMEASLNNLQKIKDLRVISRTSVEKYRNTHKTVREIAEELNVNYLVEGSGQRVGDQVLLNIQLIDASQDTPVWAEQYNHKVVNVFSLENAVAKKIADAIQAKVTPAELERIEKKPTKNLVAYDYYLKALEPFQTETKEGLEAAIPLFKKAIEQDPHFALAYSKIAIAYYYLDINQVEKQYVDAINYNADKALLYDPKSAESLIAKALYYMDINEFRYAIPHLEKALEYNPNSSAVVNMLSSLYANAIPNTAKSLEYALKGVQLDIAANDSIGKSYIYLNLSNAFIQNGFTEEALKYIDLSLDYNPQNYYAPYLKIYIQYAKHQNLDKTKKLLVREWKKDTTRLDIMQEVAKLYYFQEKYDSAFNYYKKFVKIKEENGLNIYPQENLKIGMVYEKMGMKKRAEDFYKAYTDYCENDQSLYQPASLAMKYLHEDKPDLAIEQLKLFASKNNYQYWILLFLEKDPLMKTLKNHPEYDVVVQKIKDRFWENNRQLKKSLKQKGLI
ncbi:helix-turn-helix domain-containing protein [Aequorivita capsosiphonis]|uniref:helix-turn-helix domain-containing protein n=1 Tax=Aequorivita capsosiphonis TaxID=487317 RepID=UPI00041F6B88|nr:helix-turn-helix domain-containing protein [Aequorivita capsosiphonis]